MDYLTKLKNLRTQREMIACEVSDKLLYDAIEHVRYASSARNLQILRYALINDSKKDDIFAVTNLPVVHNISEDQAPSAYIVIGALTERKQENLYGMDMGIAVQIIREYLFDQGYASVCINSFNRSKVKEIVGNDDFYPENLIAIGCSKQIVNIEDSVEEVSNYRNEKNEHTVRKLTAETLIINK